MVAAIFMGLLQMTLCAQEVSTAANAESQISEKSGLPLADVHQLLHDCLANQQSMTFCAWRDRIEADDRLSLAVAQWAKASTTCKTAIADQVIDWKKGRDQRCAKSANDGSSATAEVAACQASMTADYAKHFKPATNCR